MYVYIIECEDGSLYTGIAKDIIHRLLQHYHHLPGCAKYTLSHQMLCLRALWRTEDKRVACRLEYRIKRLSKIQKEKLIGSPTDVISIFPSIEESMSIEIASLPDMEEIKSRYGRKKDNSY